MKIQADKGFIFLSGYILAEFTRINLIITLLLVNF